MYDELLLVLRLCQSVIKTHKDLDALEYATLASEISKQIEWLESMQTPPIRKERVTKP